MAADIRLANDIRLLFMARSAVKMVSGRAMNSLFARFTRLLMLALILSVAAVQPAAAQQDTGPSVLRDTETELLFKQMSLPLIQAAGLDPHNVNVVLLNDPEINAFVATGQTVYVQSGLLVATDNVDQLQGVVAHELGHVIAGDSIRSAGGAREATRNHHPLARPWRPPRSRPGPARPEWAS